MLPEPVIERHGRVYVVRDDLLAGGTKRRALMAVLPLLAQSAREFVYATPAYGYAQIALAYACLDLGYKTTLFVAKRNALHPRTQEAKSAAATIVEVPFGYLSNVTARARAYCVESGATLVPFGLDAPLFIDAIANVARSLPLVPRSVWAVAGSGVLIRGLQRAWPIADINAIRVGAEPSVGRAKLFVAAEPYEKPAKNPPPFPSCPEYDAKAWAFIEQHADDGALFWNVAA